MKRIYLLLFLCFVFVLFADKVYASDELTCIYGKGFHKYMLIQHQDDTFELFESVTEEEKWGEFNFNYELYSTDRIILSSENSFKNCPPFLFVSIPQTPSAYGAIYGFHFSDLDSGFDLYYFNRYEKIDEKNEEIDVPIEDEFFYSNYNSKYYKEVEEVNKNDGWSAICGYKGKDKDGNFVLYFNDEKYIIINESNNCHMSILNFSIDQINEYFEGILFNCPPRLYVEENGLSDLSSKVSHTINLDGRYGDVFVNVYNKVNVYQPEPDEPIDITDCRTLLGDDIINKINDIMDVVKIVIPILLIVFGIVDFTKAIFAGKSDDMSKSQKTFIKRIVAAFLVFIAPFFINLVLDLANEVWGNISADNCISENE